MNLRSRFVLALALAFAVTAAQASEFKAGEVIVKYKDGFVRTRSTMNALYQSVGVKSVKSLGDLMKGYEQLILEDSVKVEDAIFALQKSELVEYAQPNYILHLPKYIHHAVGPNGTPCVIPGIPFPPGCDDGGQPPAPPGDGGPCIFPGIPFPPGCTDQGNPTPTPPANRPNLQDAPKETNPPVADPDLGKAYGISKISAPQAWGIHKGDKKFIVAVIDTGIDYNHEDLAFNVWRNPSPTNGDVVGFDFIHNDGLPFDDNEHGTHTSGTIGATGGNGIGVSGVNQRVSIMALKFLSGQGSGTTADAVKAVDYAIAHGAKVLSNSWGGPADPGNQALYDAINHAKDKDVLFVAAAGNDGVDNDSSSKKGYPASFDNDNLISVAATDSNDAMASFSNYGLKTTHVGAPGVDVYSTVPGNKYASFSGTSMACPHVAGAAALVWSMHPQYTYKKVKEVLMATVDPVASLKGKTVSGGRINVMKAIQAQ